MSVLTAVANTVRTLSADQVEEARSGHPGLPLGCAEIGAALFGEIMRHDPLRPDWPNRDRFILSAGHGSAWLYSLLHLSGYEVTLDDLRRFRQLGSNTPGHPEYGYTPGVETTTGPLGAGFGNAVGMAIAERMLAQKFNRPDFPIVDHRTYVLAGDGDMMEGISSEAASLAGHLGLGNLIVIYDDNSITIDGSTDLAFTESVGDRFKAYGWAVESIDGHDIDAIKAAVERAQQETQRPSLIIAKTRIGRYSTKEGSAESHGAPLGEDSVRALKETLGMPADKFYVSDDVKQYFANKRAEWQKQRQDWEALFERWSQAYPELRVQWDAAHKLELPAELKEELAALDAGKPVATRQASGMALQIAAKQLPYLVGGSADLSPSNNSYIEGEGAIKQGDFSGRNIHFGVREHAMGAIANGMALHGGLRPYVATFLVFSDYMRPTIRLAALMKQPTLHIFTHDSIYLGEDGPTHQPIEHLEALRVIPNVHVYRPATTKEVGLAWWHALKRTDGPSVLALSRQALPVLQGAATTAENFARGGYTIRREREDQPLSLVFIATGSEVSTAWEAAERLEAEGYGVRVVSVPCRETLLEQPADYLDELLGGDDVKRIAVEAGVAGGWYRLTRPDDVVYCLERFGESGPGDEVAAHFGFTVDALTDKARELLQG